MEPPRRTIRRRHTLGDRPKSQPSLSKRDQRNLAPAAKDWREAAYSLGILKTGYLETASEAWDRNTASNSTVKKTRFVVLTHAQLSWFKRNPGDSEYGDERGAIPLDQVTSVKLDGEEIEVFDQGGLRRWFLCRDGKAKAWRDAIDVARQARCRSPAASSPREAPSALIIRTRQYAKSIVETRAAYGAATLVEPALRDLASKKRIDAGDRAAFNRFYGDLLYTEGRYEEALVTYLKADRGDHTDARVWHGVQARRGNQSSL